MNASAEQGAAALTLAVQLYRKECDRSGIHENRFLSWQELDSNAKRLWIETAEQQLGIGVATVTDKERITGTDVLAKAMEMYEKSGIGGMPVMTKWDDLTNAKKQKWLDIARDHMGVIGPKTYIGTKVVKGTPMTRGDYNHLRGWDIPVGENPADAGYLVEYVDGGPANHPDYENYISWSPKDVFEKAYLPAEENLTFSQALELLKAGKQITRAGWNAPGQFVYLMPGSKIQAAAGYGFGEYIGEPEFVQAIVLRNAQNKLVVGWVPSTGDLFATDWKLA